jgi:formate C-acetyltransferase
MFVTYPGAGAPVGATPDGRRAGEPIADSIGPYQGRDRRGPTAMLRSVAKLPLDLAVGTPILNARFARDLFLSPDGRRKLIGLIRTYFGLGGLQIQVNVVDQAVLRDAIEHPDRHGDLLIRVGGYSDLFVRLPLDLQKTILERTEHEA